ncbi:MAG: hypothetical protein LBM07_00455 [Culturomica sp.]|jgi:hypothetical protein|nr:hypothetical protein [Culturomica sp.]
MKSKVSTFFLIFLFITCFVYCSEENNGDYHVIPNIRVSVDINLSYADYQDLNFPGQPVYYNQAGNNGDVPGYNGNGLVIIMMNSDEYECFDATCTHCLEGIVEVEKGNVTGICDHCATEFLLNFYGQPSNIPEEDNDEKIYPLKRYAAIKQGNYLRIRN